MPINKRRIFNSDKNNCTYLCIYRYCPFLFAGKVFVSSPKKLSSSHSFKFDGRFEESFVPFNEEDTMSLVKFFPQAIPSRGVVIYFHGNMSNVEHYAPFMAPFLKNGYEVWVGDYPGFGKSTGTITERKLVEQALQVKKMADVKFNTDSIIIYGKSLGTGIAANVASRSKAKMLILETPYYSIPSLFNCYAFIYPNSLMSNYKLPTGEFVADVQYPITVFHGTNDNVIPYRCAAQLKPVLKTTDKFITIEGASHNNLNSTSIYFNAIDSLLK